MRFFEGYFEPFKNYAVQRYDGEISCSFWVTDDAVVSKAVVVKQQLLAEPPVAFFEWRNAAESSNQCFKLTPPFLYEYLNHDRFDCSFQLEIAIISGVICD